MILALPATGRGPRPTPRATDTAASLAKAQAWQVSLQAAVQGSTATLEAVIGRLRLPLSALMTLEAGMTLPLGPANIGTVTLHGPGGREVAIGRLGQSQGARALRLTLLGPEAAAGGAPVTPVAATASPAPPPAVAVARSA